jgi:FAD/FMN-containing dehydrogenase
MVGIQETALDATTTHLSDALVNDLRGTLRGQLIRPGDEAYESARRVWNGNIDRRPALIVRCAGVADVMAAVNFARDHQLVLAVRGGAHSAAGHGTCDGGMVIDLGELKGIRVDPQRHVAWAQAGVVWSELDAETQEFGLATTGGLVSNTGIAGLTLGGGMGWLMGKHGYSVDNLRALDVVTADGRFLTASADEHADLFWGLRGGGGNFGIVTSFEYQLHPVGPIVLGGLVIHPLEHAQKVLRFYREFSRELPDEAEAYAGLLTTPEGIPVVGLILGYNGPIDEGERVLAPARQFGAPLADLVQPMPYVARQSMLDEGNAVHGIHRYWKSGFTETISDQLLDVLIEGATTISSPMSAILFFNIHGAGARVPADATAVGLRGNKWDLNVISQWLDPAESPRHIAWTRELWGQIEPLISGSAYLNHLAGDDQPEKVRASFGANYERLVALKQQYDPTNLFRLNPNVKPGS